MTTPRGFIPWYMPNIRGVVRVGTGALARPDPDSNSHFDGFGHGRRGRGVDRAAHPRWRACPPGLFDGRSDCILVSYDFHMQDLSLACLPMMSMMNRWAERRNQAAPISLAWGAVLIAVASLYGFRVIAIASRGCSHTDAFFAWRRF